MGENSKFENLIMQTRNIIYEVYYNKLTDQQAADILEQAYEDFHYGKLKLDPREYACMSYQELTALSLHGLYFTDIAKFRYEGWPNKCMLCNKDIIFGSGGTGWWTYRAKLIRGKVIKNVFLSAFGAGFGMGPRASTAPQ